MTAQQQKIQSSNLSYKYNCYTVKFKANVDTGIMQEPSFLMVLTATDTAFQMKNGVWVVPLGCLKN